MLPDARYIAQHGIPNAVRIGVLLLLYNCFMPSVIVAVLLLFCSYLIGAIPFGYIIGRLRGINLFHLGSGNIGATNAARVLGWPLGVLVFVLDFLKGAVPVAVIVPVLEMFGFGTEPHSISIRLWQVSAAGLAFLGHLYPVYLGFRGGKGVATGAGTLFVLVPIPTVFALLFWGVILLATRMVSVASLTAVSVLLLIWLLTTPMPFDHEFVPVTSYLLLGAGLVVLKHRGNLTRILAGTENQIRDFAMRETTIRAVHLLALGLWFGGAAFFNLIAAVPIFDSFKQVVNSGPSDRTAFETIIPPDASQERKDALANALAGSAVGPIFPRYFMMSAVCGALALVTAMTWWKTGVLGQLRVWVIGVAFITVVIGWPVSNYVSELRLERFASDPSTAAKAKEAFSLWHLISLLLSLLMVSLTAIALALGAQLTEAHTPVQTMQD